MSMTTNYTKSLPVVFGSWLVGVIGFGYTLSRFSTYMAQLNEQKAPEQLQLETLHQIILLLRSSIGGDQSITMPVSLAISYQYFSIELLRLYIEQNDNNKKKIIKDTTIDHIDITNDNIECNNHNESGQNINSHTKTELSTQFVFFPELQIDNMSVYQQLEMLKHGNLTRAQFINLLNDLYLSPTIFSLGLVQLDIDHIHTILDKYTYPYYPDWISMNDIQAICEIVIIDGMHNHYKSLNYDSQQLISSTSLPPSSITISPKNIYAPSGNKFHQYEEEYYEENIHNSSLEYANNDTNVQDSDLHNESYIYYMDSLVSNDHSNHPINNNINDQHHHYPKPNHVIPQHHIVPETMYHRNIGKSK